MQESGLFGPQGLGEWSGELGGAIPACFLAPNFANMLIGNRVSRVDKLSFGAAGADKLPKLR
jgi:hypothetical protein